LICCLLNGHPPVFSLLPTPQTEDSVNKAELIDAVAMSADMPKASAARAVEASVEAITATLKAGDQVSLVGFGTFVAKARPARNGRNPKTGETITIAASNVPAFKPGKGLKDALNL
jgi:DNA-binding protein HU-beta